MKIIISLFFILFVRTTMAIPTIYALHINGIDTTRNEAYYNLEELRKAANVDASTSLLKWDVIYNPTATINNDVANTLYNIQDVMFQKMGEAMELTSDDLVQTYMLMNNLNYPLNSPEYNSLANELGNNIKNEFLGRNFDEIVNEFHNQVPPELEPALTALAGHDTKDYGKTKNYVLLIPHSQGI